MATKPTNNKSTNQPARPINESNRSVPGTAIRGGFGQDSANSVSPVQMPRSALPPAPPKKGGK